MPRVSLVLAYNGRATHTYIYVNSCKQNGGRSVPSAHLCKVLSPRQKRWDIIIVQINNLCSGANCNTSNILMTIVTSTLVNCVIGSLVKHCHAIFSLFLVSSTTNNTVYCCRLKQKQLLNSITNFINCPMLFTFAFIFKLTSHIIVRYIFTVRYLLITLTLLSL